MPDDLKLNLKTTYDGAAFEKAAADMEALEAEKDAAAKAEAQRNVKIIDASAPAPSSQTPASQYGPEEPVNFGAIAAQRAEAAAFMQAAEAQINQELGEGVSELQKQQAVLEAQLITATKKAQFEAELAGDTTEKNKLDAELKIRQITLQTLRSEILDQEAINALLTEQDSLLAASNSRETAKARNKDLQLADLQKEKQLNAEIAAQAETAAQKEKERAAFYKQIGADKNKEQREEERLAKSMSGAETREGRLMGAFGTIAISAGAAFAAFKQGMGWGEQIDGALGLSDAVAKALGGTTSLEQATNRAVEGMQKLLSGSREDSASGVEARLKAAQAALTDLDDANRNAEGAQLRAYLDQRFELERIKTELEGTLKLKQEAAAKEKEHLEFIERQNKALEEQAARQKELADAVAQARRDFEDTDAGGDPEKKLTLDKGRAEMARKKIAAEAGPLLGEIIAENFDPKKIVEALGNRTGPGSEKPVRAGLVSDIQNLYQEEARIKQAQVALDKKNEDDLAGNARSAGEAEAADVSRQRKTYEDASPEDKRKYVVEQAGATSAGLKTNANTPARTAQDQLNSLIKTAQSDGNIDGGEMAGILAAIQTLAKVIEGRDKPADTRLAIIEKELTKLASQIANKG